MSADRPVLMTPLPRLRSVLLVAAGLGVGLLLSAFAPHSAAAQSAAADSASLFRPASDADPRAARFRRGTPRRSQDGRSRFGDIPAFGNPPASGAGATGFDSTNASRPRPRSASQSKSGASTVRSLAASGAAQVVPVRAAPEPGRRGAVADPAAASAQVVPTIATPTRRRLAAEPDPFDPVGLRLGSLTLWPAIELTGGYDSNPTHSSFGRASSLLVVAPELKLRSDWQRHALSADIKGTYTAYAETFACCNPDGTLTGSPNSLNRPSLDSKVNGRIDVNSRNRVEVEGRMLVGTDSPGSPNVPFGLERLPIFTMFGGTLGYVHSFNRFEIAAKGGVDRRVYDQSLLVNGATDNNDDRNYNQYAGALRGSYELLPGVKPFVEGNFDTRVHDLEFDRNHEDRDSVGQAIRAGTTFEFSRKLTGEMSAGYLNRRYADPTLSGIGGFVFDSSLIWAASPLTTATLTGKSTVDEIIVQGASGVLRRDFGVQVDHALRRWLIGTFRLGYGFDDYVGMDRQDQRYFASAGLVYKLNRNAQLKGEYRHDWLTSTAGSANYVGDTVMLGLRLQR
jgi:hypothetical protein